MRTVQTTVAVLAALLLLGCSKEPQQEELDGPEAVRYDPELDLFFVSNFNGEVAGDANGFVSKLSPDGDLLVREFMVGTEDLPFHGGRGMFITESGLWVVDAGGVHLFDRLSGEQLDFIDFSAFELGFLNDIVMGRDDALYVTDTGTDSLYRIVDRTVELVTKVPMSPNGITIDPMTGKLLMVAWTGSDEVIAWDIDEQEFSSVGKLNGGGNFDGVEVVGGDIIVASQTDTSLHFVVAGQDSKVITLQGKPADIGIDTRRNTIAVPYVALDLVEIISLKQ
jgi:sugar lactone lactonase YvrE